VNVGAGRKKDCLKKLTAIPILLRSVDEILRIRWSGKWNEHEARKILMLYRKMGCTSTLRVQWVISGKVDGS
jgi:hypothetical protein